MEYPILFIRAGAQRNEMDHPVSAPYMRRAFSIKEIPAAAPLEITAAGFYELFINGKRITRGMMAPYISNPDDALYVDTYDLRPYLHVGENVLGLLLGNGLVNSPNSGPSEFTTARFRAAPSVALRLQLGETVIQSDASFRTAPSPVLSDDYRGGESYDARRELPGWAEPGYDDSGWAFAEEAPPPRGELIPNIANPIVVIGERQPVSVERAGDTYLYDFGVNSAGVCRLRIRGAQAGQKITLYHRERLWPNGLSEEDSQYKEPDFDYGQTDCYICKGGEMEEWTPRFTYHGFSYVEVAGLTPEQAAPDALLYQELSTDMRERGGFRCSNAIANAVCDITLRSARSNFQHYLTDCPHREKNGWTADAALSTENILLFLEPDNNFRQWMQMLRKAQAEQGGLPGIVPTSGHAYTHLNGPAWDCAVIWVPYYLWKYRGDLAVVRENAHAMLRYLEYLTTRVREDGLVAFGLGDWSHAGRGAWLFKAPVELTDTVTCMDMCAKAAVLFEAAGRPLQAAFARSFYDQLRAAARKRLLDFQTATVLGNCQTSQAMAIHYNLFEPGEKPAAFARLVEMIERDGGVMDVGVLGGRVLFHVLAEFGKAELAFRLITQPDFPSFGWLIAQGATTLWENFMLPKTKWLDSRNHQFWGDVGHWFLRWLAGIHYDCPAHRLDIRPQFIEALEYAEGYHLAPEGKIFVRWERAADGIQLDVEVPEGLQGYMFLPDGYSFEDERYDSGVFVKPAASGRYKLLPYKIEGINRKS